MKALFNNTITLNVFFCISYFVLAMLGFQWGALTANASLLWPPSGFAVFGCIVFGRRVLPGLLLGAIISSQSISLSNPMDNNLLGYLIGCVNGSASILQAFLIAHLSKNYYLRNFQVSTSAAFSFTLMILACCTLATSIGNVMLWQTGIITFSTALQNWTVWWMGDAIGVLVLAPPLVWVYRNQAVYKNSQSNAFLIFCAGIGIVLLTVTAVGYNERETFKRNLIHDTENLQNNMQANIDWATRDLSTLQEYFLNNPPTQDEFRKLTEPLLKRNLWLDSFSWTPAQDAARYKLQLDFDAGITLSRTNDLSFVWKKPDSNFFTASFLDSLTKQLIPAHSEIFFRATQKKLTHLTTLQSLIWPRLFMHAMLRPKRNARYQIL